MQRMSLRWFMIVHVDIRMLKILGRLEFLISMCVNLYLLQSSIRNKEIASCCSFLWVSFLPACLKLVFIFETVQLLPSSRGYCRASVVTCSLKEVIRLVERLSTIATDNVSNMHLTLIVDANLYGIYT